MKSPRQPFLETMRLNANKKVLAQSANQAAAGQTAGQTTVQRVHCPTCGSSAERYRLNTDSIVRTQCSRCDYLMVMCSKTGRVIESYSPGMLPSMLAAG